MPASRRTQDTQDTESQTVTQTQDTAPDAQDAYAFPNGTLDMFQSDIENPNIADPRYVEYRDLCRQWESAQTTGIRAGLRGKLRRLAVDMTVGETGPEIDFVVWVPPSERTKTTRDPNMTAEQLSENVAKVFSKLSGVKGEIRTALNARLDALMRASDEYGYAVADPRKTPAQDAQDAS